MKTLLMVYLTVTAFVAAAGRRLNRLVRDERGDVTSTVIIVAVLVAAGIGAGLVITNFVNGENQDIINNTNRTLPTVRTTGKSS